MAGASRLLAVVFEIRCKSIAKKRDPQKWASFMQ